MMAKRFWAAASIDELIQFSRIMSSQKLISWNVNGLRAVMKKGFEAFLKTEQPDVLCLQETKISRELTDQFVFADYPYVYWNCAVKKGYSGTALFSKTKPLSVEYGLGIEKHDGEGRLITAEFENYFIVTVYTPNSQGHDENKRPKRLDYRTKEWDVDFLEYVKSLEDKKPVVFCGDLNVAHKEIDLSNPQQNRRNAGFTDEERARFDAILEAGFIDSFRLLYPDATHRYSWWSYRGGARARNVGWRLDYFCVSQALGKKIEDALILDAVEGSDHCPVALLMNDSESSGHRTLNVES